MSPSSTRQLRIFLSSTFSDMQEERDALVKLFRELSNEGKRRGVDIRLVDLRWGVTDDQRRTGRVISTCLQEIDNSRPFFIGMIGDRYGWVPTKEELGFNPELREKFPIVEEYAARGLSITEIEMRYGVLDSSYKDNSLFLIKRGISFENNRHRNLSEELVSGNLRHDFYESIPDLVEKTRSVMMELLDANYPLLTQIPEWQQYENSHGNIAKAHRSDYIRYGDYVERLNSWLRSDSRHLVVTGAPGSGKSSLISDWIGQNDLAGYKVVFHFIGSEMAEGSQLEVQRHFLTRLEHEYGLPPTPKIKKRGGDEDYILQLEHALEVAEEHGDRWLLIVDGLDHLENVAITKLMSWFPDLPTSSKALFSTVKSDLTYNRLCNALGYEELQIPPLDKKFVKEIAIDYLANVGKSLDPDLTGKIVSNELFSNPFMLRLLLDELVTYGIHEQIGSIVADYTTSADKTDLYFKIIQHAQEYYGDRLVKDVCMLIAASKFGLSETAIIDILNLDPLNWSMVYSGLRPLFSFINGKYIIADQDFYDTIMRFYADNEDCEDSELISDYQRSILNYLEKDEDEGDVIMLAFLYFALDELEKLYELLLIPANFITIEFHSDILFAIYWSAIMEATDHSLYDYLNVEFSDLPDFDADEQLHFLTYMLSLHFPDGELSLQLSKKENEIYLEKGEDDMHAQSMLATNYIDIAHQLLNMGRIEEGKEMISKAEEINRRIGESEDSSFFLIKGRYALADGHYQKALNFIMKALDMETSAGEDVPFLYFNYAGMAYFYLERYDEALGMYQRALEEVNKDLIEETIEGALVIQNIGLTYYRMNDLDKAEEFYLRALDTYRANLENPGIQVALLLNNLGLIYQDRENTDQAMEYFMEASDILDTVSEKTLHSGLVYQNIGRLLQERGETEKAIEWMKKSVEVYSELVPLSNNEFSISCRGLMDLYCEAALENEMYEFADALIKQADEEIGVPNQVSPIAHLNLGDLFLAWEENEDAIREYQAARHHFLLLGDDEGVQIADELIADVPE